jgi:hypothetical protein
LHGLVKLANLSGFLFSALPELRRLAFAVMPEWCQKHPAQTPKHPLLPRFRLTYAKSERVTDGTRTRDLRSHNPMLCQLSYGHQAHARFYQEKVRDKTRRSEG